MARLWLRRVAPGRVRRAALMFADTYGRVVLPVAEWNKRSDIPGKVIARPIEYTGGMPGSRVGQ